MTKKYIKLFIVEPFKASKLFTIYSLICCILGGILPVLQVIVVSNFINSALASYKSNNINNEIYAWMALLVFFVAYDWINGRIIGLLKIRAEVDLLKKYRLGLVEKASRLEYKYIENSEAWDLISRVLSSTESKVLNNFNAVLGLVSLIISLIGIIVVVANYVWWSALLIFLFCIPLFVFSIKGGKASYNAQRGASMYERKCGYLHEILVNRENVEERNVFSYEKAIDEKYDETNIKAFWIIIKTNLIWVFKTRLSGGLTSAAALIIILTLIQPTLNHMLSAGMFISLVNSIFQLSSSMGYGLSSSMDSIVQGMEYVKDINTFMEMEEIEEANCEPDNSISIEEIIFDNVSFKYPGTEKYVIKNMSFALEKGKHYAFVGMNGAGKTTAIKLLTGLYPYYEGNIFINGKELRKYKQREIKGMFSVVYQDFAKYYLTLKDNILMGNVNEMNHIKKKIEKLISLLDLDLCVERLENGLDTNLGKLEKNSVDLSGGQWQRVAMARGLLNPADVRILDEPTAALDPVMESKMYKLFKDLVEDKLTIFISHRLGSINIADEILVFEKGRISERGTFEEIMNLKGTFYEMYDKQRGWYHE